MHFIKILRRLSHKYSLQTTKKGVKITFNSLIKYCRYRYCSGFGTANSYGIYLKSRYSYAYSYKLTSLSA